MSAPRRSPLVLPVILVLLAGCGGGDGGDAPRAASTPAQAPKEQVVTAAQINETALGTKRAVVLDRFGKPQQVQRQDAGGKTVECLIYPGEGKQSYARFCFGAGKLLSASTVAGQAALPVAKPVKGGKKSPLKRTGSRSKPIETP